MNEFKNGEPVWFEHGTIWMPGVYKESVTTCGVTIIYLYGSNGTRFSPVKIAPWNNGVPPNKKEDHPND